MASKQELMDLPVELLQRMITYIPSKDLLNLSSIRNRELSTLMKKELEERRLNSFPTQYDRRTRIGAKGKNFYIYPPQSITKEELLDIASQYGIYIPKGSTKAEMISVLVHQNNIFKKIQEES